MPPRGGLADKIGNRYEGRIAIGRLLQLLDDQHDSVLFRLEQPGDDSFEWWMQSTSGSRRYTQVKRQQAPDREWAIKTLISRGVIPAFGRRLDEEPDAHCEFFSALSASHLQQLSDDARMAGSLQEFEETFVAAKNKKASWDELQGAWKGTPEQAWQWLRRVSAGNTDEESLRENLRAHARALVNAPPDDVIARLGDFLDDHLAEVLTADDVWGYLREECGFRPTDWSRDQDVRHRIRDETARYRTGVTEDRYPLTEIRRSAAGVIADLLAAPGGPQVITVTAGAGDGKSALLGQVLDELQARAEADPAGGCPRTVLATRLDRLDGFRDARELGTAMRLPGPPAAVLSRVAAGRPALLVLDQVDAFGTGSGRNPARLEAVTEALREARALGIKVIIACREFDLKEDDRLARLAGLNWKGQPVDGHYVERLGPLPAQDVADTLRAVGIDRARLTPSLLQLLSTPLHLRMLVRLQKRGDLDPAGIGTRLQLFDKFYAAVIEEAEARQPGALVVKVSDRLALLLSEQQDLSAAEARLSDHRGPVDSLVRAGWLSRDGGRIAFAHEAFFDYAYARQHMRSGRSLLSLLRSGEQHLFRRAQVRQILALEREQERKQYLSDVRDVLAADDVRPHLKELVTALVTLVPDPGLDEWEALGVLGDATAGSLAERVCWLAAQAAGFSRLLLDEGIISAYLCAPDTAELGTSMCRLMARSHPAEVARLLHPYARQAGWAGRLGSVLTAAPLDRSEEMVTLMTEAIDAGAFDDAVRHPTLSGGDFFTLMHAFKSESAALGTMLVAAWLRRRLALLTADGAYNQPREPAGTGGSSDGDDGAVGEERDDTADPASTGAGEANETDTTQDKTADYIRTMHEARNRLLLGDSMSAPEILATLAAGNPVAFSRNILPVVRQASAASRTGKTGIKGERDEAFGEPPDPDCDYDANQALIVRLAQAVEAAAGQGDPQTLAAVRDMAGSPLATEQLLAAAGFASGRPDLLTDAAAWLQSGPYALEQGWLGRGRNLSAKVLARVCVRLPAEQTGAVQERAAAYSTSYEARQRQQYGSAAWELLYEVPDENLTPPARARKAELRRKFPPPVTAAPAPAGQQPPDTTVLPPVTAGEVRRMSDSNLVNAMRRWSSDEWQPQPGGRLRGGANSFGDVISAVAGEDPGRFTAVLETLPPGINPVYTTNILQGLRQSATPEQSLRAAWAARAHLSTSAIQIGQLIERAAPHVNAALLGAAGITGRDLLELLRRLLDQPPPVPADTAQPGDGSDRGEAEQPEATQITGEKIADQLLFCALNRPEYPALRALAVLAPAFPQAAELLAAELSRLAASPVLAVRALVIELSVTQFSAGPGTVTALLARTLDSSGTEAGTGPEPMPADSRLLLASSQLCNLLLRLCWTQYDIAEPVVARMIAFSRTAAAGDVPAALKAAATQAAHNAAMIATVAACRHPAALALTQRLAARELPFRRGITAALAKILPTGEVNDELASVLAGLFEDPDDELARRAGHVLTFLPPLQDDLARRLLSAACQAKTFTLEPSRVITAADKYQGEISATVLEIAEQFFELHHSQAGDLRGKGGHAASILGRLVIGIYARETRDPALAARTLNLIDAMVLARSYGLEDQLTLLDR